MVFASFSYLLFLPLVVFLHWMLPERWRLPFLLLASYLFYMSWIPAFVLLIIGMTVFNWLWGKQIAKYYGSDKANLIFGIGLATNLSCLGIFKYANFFIDSCNSLIGFVTGNQPDYALNIILPLAISFFTFEFIHYQFEIHKGNKPVDSFILFALFAAFFPTQIAGPIKRYQDFVNQMQKKRTIKLQYFDDGVPLIILGLAKKVLLADNLAILVNMGYKVPGEFSSPELWLFAYAFAFQIYFDFSGYTDIARGSAMLFGYKIPINFNLPYIAKNASDFWHRWHISLSTWLRDYLFIPLGGSRGGKWQTNRNLLLTMALGGLWHGAAWNFIVWGIYHGIALIIHRAYSRWADSVNVLCRLRSTKAYDLLATILTFHFVCIGWVFFRVQNIGTSFSIIERMIFWKTPEFSNIVVLQPHLPLIVFVNLIILALLLLFNIPLSYLAEKNILQNTPIGIKAAFCTILIFLMVTFLPEYSVPFIYFQF